MFASLLALVLTASLPQAPLMDGFDRVVVLDHAKKYAAASHLMSNYDRRVYVESCLLWHAEDLGELDRKWLRQVADWASRPFDVDPPKAIPVPQWREVYRLEVILGGNR